MEEMFEQRPEGGEGVSDCKESHSKQRKQQEQRSLERRISGMCEETKVARDAGESQRGKAGRAKVMKVRRVGVGGQVI